MANSELDILKGEIDALREQMHAYMEYPEIFKDELLESSNKIDKEMAENIKCAKIDMLINKYIVLRNK